MKRTYTLVIQSGSSEASLENAFRIWAQAQGIELDSIQQGDQTNRDFFSVIRWHEADIEEALRDSGMKVTDENVKLVKEQGRNLRDRSVEFGNEVLKDIISDIDFQGQLEK